MPSLLPADRSPLSLSGDSPTASQAAKIGIFDATMVVVGGIIGVGIFMNPYVVARRVHTPTLILGAWIAGGAIALLGAFIYAELASRMPRVGGQYAYLREAYHPLVGFVYGWCLLLVIQTGGMAAVALTFAQYFLEITHWPLPGWSIAVLALAALTVINLLGVRPGARVQSGLTVLRIFAITALILAGVFLVRGPGVEPRDLATDSTSHDTVSGFLGAMLPVLFAFGGWQTCNFVAGEIREPRRNLPRALLMGIAIVIGLYLTVNFVYVWALGARGLAETTTPASAVMRAAMGARGAQIIAAGIAVSALGFLSQSILTAPRVYFSMAADGVFFRAVARVNQHNVPGIAIALQSLAALVIALTGQYETILNYAISMDFLFFGLTATTLFVFRQRELQVTGEGGMNSDSASGIAPVPGFRVPGHPATTLVFIIASWMVFANSIYRYPKNTLIGLGILLLGIPVGVVWRRMGKTGVSGNQ